jgi:hypothetical protein
VKIKNILQKVWWIEITLLLLLGCRLPGVFIPFPVLPTATPILPTSTLLPPTLTAIPPTPTTLSQADQARDFAGPILQAIADRNPDFEDDFSAANKSWQLMFASHGQDGTFAIEDGVARFRLRKAQAYMTNRALDQKDYVLQYDARLAAGDEGSLLQVNFHLLSQDKWHLLYLLSEPGTWQIVKMWNDPGRTLIEGSGNVSPVGEATRVMIVTRGAKSAIYLNDIPIAYIEDPDFDAPGKIMFFCSSTTATVCEFDNVKFWNLVKVPGLP